ncbi:MAG TPA: type II secretion system protein GspJ [Kofleriaceae bacterium]|nr:type II secretion system protein GspJ [Kofleriaceae bacterium]
MKRQAGMTLIEIMIAIAIMSVMMVMAWTTTSSTQRASTEFGGIQLRNHEIRVALDRVVADLESAYLSQNEDMNATERRTLFVARGGGTVPELRFTSLSHMPLWADAHESEQTLISYSSQTEKEDGTKTDWLRRESRRLSNKPWKQEPADVDVLIHDVEKVEFMYWNWQNQEWQDHWDTTQSDGERMRLPARVKIIVTFKNPRGEDVKITTEASILLQEPLTFITS